LLSRPLNRKALLIFSVVLLSEFFNIHHTFAIAQVRKDKLPGIENRTITDRLRVATTTSLYDTGLWSDLEPIFEEMHGVELDVLYSGTGIALEYGRRGDVDAIVVHSRDLEEQFISGGYGVERVPFAFNYFVIVGPVDDPATIRGKSPEEAFKTIAETGKATFISRGDDSGTHNKEKEIWKGAGPGIPGQIRNAGAWYIETGRGMGPTLLMASEKKAYTLTDIGTFAAYQGKIELVPLVEKGLSLLNVYSVIACNPEKNSSVKGRMASELISFLTSPEIQELIGSFGIKRYGRSLFNPCAGNEPR
jgi:tungstate transport system substrate-binding protein